MKYRCKNPSACNAVDREWECRISLESQNEQSVELNIAGKGSQLYAIIGQYEYGWYICIPEWGVGSTLAGLTDVFWNQEQLSRWLSPVDAITIAEGLRIYAKQCRDMA